MLIAFRKRSITLRIQEKGHKQPFTLDLFFRGLENNEIVDVCGA